MGYKTKQKKHIINYLCNNNNKYSSASDICLYVNKVDKIGLTTVYRILNDLALKGVVHKTFKNNKCYYQIIEENCLKHYHLKCLKCLNVIHVDISDLQEIEDMISYNYNFKINNQETIIYGLCSKCGGNNEK